MQCCALNSLRPGARGNLMRPTQQLKPFQSVRPMRIVTLRAASDDDAELEKRLEKLRLAKGSTPYGKGSKASKEPAQPAAAVQSSKKATYDYSDEKVYYEGGPATGDLAVNVALGITLIWLPLTLAAVGRAAFVKYKFTDKRISVITTAPWETKQLDAAYQEVKSVRTVGRGVGLWGDMVVELRDGSKVEIRSLERYKEIEAYIKQRRDELAGPTNEVTQAQLLGEEPQPTISGKGGKSTKGFSS